VSHSQDRSDPCSERERLSRREFLRQGLAAAAAVGAAASLPPLAGRLFGQETPAAGQAAAAGTGDAAGAGGVAGKSRVIVITHPEALVREYVGNRPVLQQMLERAVRELTGADSDKKAWQQVALPGEPVSIKTTRAGGDLLKTHDELSAYVAERLIEAAGSDKDRIRIWDRPDLRGEDLELSEPFVLPTRGKETRLRAVLVKDSPAIVNMPVLKTHSGTGASIAMKNHFGSINNPSAFHSWATGNMARSIAELNRLDPIRTRTRLIVVDATRPLFAEGPSDNPDFRWTFGGLIVGTDPVAVDAVGLDILEKKREEHFGRPWPLEHAREMVRWGQTIGLGNADASRIEVVRIKLD